MTWRLHWCTAFHLGGWDICSQLQCCLAALPRGCQGWVLIQGCLVSPWFCSAHPTRWFLNICFLLHFQFFSAVPSSLTPPATSRKVTILEDPDQNIHLKNLSLHQATTEEEALNLLFLGDTNRMIAEVTTCPRSWDVIEFRGRKDLHNDIVWISCCSVGNLDPEKLRSSLGLALILNLTPPTMIWEESPNEGLAILGLLIALPVGETPAHCGCHHSLGWSQTNRNIWALLSLVPSWLWVWYHQLSQALAPGLPQNAGLETVIVCCNRPFLPPSCFLGGSHPHVWSVNSLFWYKDRKLECSAFKDFLFPFHSVELLSSSQQKQSVQGQVP